MHEQVCPVSSREMHERGAGLESIGAAEPLLPGRDLPGQQSGMDMLLGAARPRTAQIRHWQVLACSSHFLMNSRAISLAAASCMWQAW